MPYYFEFDPVHRIVRSVLIGNITDQEMIEFYRAARQIRRLDSIASILDLSEVTSANFATSTVKSLAQSKPIVQNLSHRRFIVAPTNHLYGLARMFQLLSEPERPNLHVVRSIQEVYDALNVKNPHFEPIDERPRAVS